MKAVLMSIQPRWVELIASGKKTVEVRKTKPKLDVPFKVYIYCTKATHHFSIGGGVYATNDTLYRLPTGEVKFGDGFELMGDWSGQYDENNFLNGKVIGEFVCDRIHYVRNYGDAVDWYDCQASCLSANEIIEYAKDKNGNFVYTYGWHISNLVIYDKPRELVEFKRVCDGNCQECKYAIWQTRNPYGDPIIVDCKPISVPQSWCYVEEVKHDGT